MRNLFAVGAHGGYTPAMFYKSSLLLALLTAAIFVPTAKAAQDKAKAGVTFSGNYLAGRHAQTAHDTGNAALFLGAAAKMVPDNADLLRRAYVLTLSEGDISGGIKFLDRIEKMGGDAPLSDVVHAAELIKSGKFNAVEKYFKTDDKKDKKLTGINAYVGPILHAWAMAGEGKFANAIKMLEKSKGNSGSVAFFELHLGLINDMGGNANAAEKNYNAVIIEAGISLRLAQHFGGLLERSGKTDEALSIYKKYDAIAEGTIITPATSKRIATKTKPKPDIDNAAHGAAEAMFGLASSLSNQGAMESALVLAQLALYLRSDFPPAIIVVGGVLETYQRSNDANALYAKIPKSSVMYNQAKLKTAANMEKLKKPDEAIKLLKALAKDNKSDGQILIELGDVLRRNEKFNDAANTYSKALDLIKKIENRHWGIFYSRGISFERDGNWAKAEADFLTALKMEPDQPFVLNYLGYSWIEKKLNLEKAVAMIQKAVELRPRDGYIVDSLGWGLYQLADYKNATKRLERAVLLRPEDSIINNHLGDALWRVGRQREARFQWERALGLEPDPKDEIELKQKLKSGLPDLPALPAAN